MFKLLIVALLGCVVVFMAFSLKAMYRKSDNKEDMARALTWRVAISVGLFLLLMIGMKMGWVTPNQI